MTDVAIAGVGIYPFGRHKDVTALEMGAAAARAALADAGMTWSDIPYAVGGSFEVDIPAAMVAYLGLTGIDFTNVYNGCATAGTALSLRVQAIRSGRHDRVLVVGLDKHPAGAFTADPAGYGCPAWYGEMGLPALPCTARAARPAEPSRFRPRPAAPAAGKTAWAPWSSRPAGRSIPGRRRNSCPSCRTWAPRNRRPSSRGPRDTWSWTAS